MRGKADDPPRQGTEQRTRQQLGMDRMATRYQEEVRLDKARHGESWHGAVGREDEFLFDFLQGRERSL
jgi:hypothetical protein